MFTSGSLNSINKIPGSKGSFRRSRSEFDDNEEYDEDDTSVKRFLTKSPVVKTKYEEFGNVNEFPLVTCSANSPQPTSENYMSANSRLSRRSRVSSAAKLNCNEG